MDDDSESYKKVNLSLYFLLCCVVLQELMLPVSELGKFLLSLALWEDPIKSLAFCLVSSYIIYR